MAEKNNATCSICGKPYHMCISCADTMSSSPWKVHTDTSEHYKVFQVIRGYNTGVYTKAEAKDKLEKIDLSDLNTFRDNVKKSIKEIRKVNADSYDVEKNDDVVQNCVATETTPKTSRKKVYEVAETE